MIVTGLIVSAPAAVAVTETPETTSFYVNANDLDFILRQIQIAEAHDQRTTTGQGVGPLLCSTPTDTTGKCVPDAKLPFGLRTVDGSFNNLVNGRTHWGAADQPFDRLVEPEYKQGSARPNVPQAPGSGQDVSMCDPLPAGTPATLTPTCYEQSAPGHFVYDTAPRTISNLIVDQTASNPAAVNAAEATVGGMINPDGTAFIPNTATDEGLSAPTNTFFAFFGQFFDHGLDLVNKGGNGTIVVPLQPDDPLYDATSNTNFLTLTRAERGAGADGVVGTVDDTHNNQTTPYVDQNQTYTSHPSHQVFLREYELVDGAPVATGQLLNSAEGGIPTWADIKTQAREMLGIDLADDDVLNVPMVATDIYGNFIPGDNGLPLLVTADGTVPANRGSPVDTAPALHTNHAFLDDIAHGATPLFDCATGALVPQEYDEQGEPIPPTVAVCDAGGAPVRGELTGYDNVTLDEHFITGDGRGNENIGLTAVHHVFHSEHNNMVAQIETVLAANPELDKAFHGLEHQWPNERPQDVLPGPEADDWSYGQRLFQAARFVTEMEYQHLVFEEFARSVQPAIDAVVFNENSYNPNVNVDVPAEFAHSVYRFGHSMMTEDIGRTGFGTADVPLLDGFINPRAYDQEGALTPDEAAGSLIMGTTGQTSSQIDEFVVDTLRNNLLGLPLDLATINLLRARDTGTPSLQAARELFYGQTGDVSLRPYANWTDFGNGLKNGNIFGRGGLNASLVNFVAAYGTHPTVVAAQTVAQKRLAASYLVNGAPAGREFIQRFGGVDRYETAALLSRATFTTGANVAYVSSGFDFPDALVGGPAAAQNGGPILLTAPTYVPVSTSAELQRLNPSRIVVLGGTGVVSADVVNTLRGIAPVTRIAGADRYETAARVSAATFSAGVDRVYVAVGNDFPDALAGGAVASKSGDGGLNRSGAPILLTQTNRIPQSTATELRRLNPQKIIVLGGPGVVSATTMRALDAFTSGTVERQSGNDRYGTAASVSRAAYPSGSDTLYVATGRTFPDALAAAPLAGRADAPLLLVPTTGTIPQVVRNEIARLGVTRIVILGGLGAVDAGVETQLAAYAPVATPAPADRHEFMASTGSWSNRSTGLDEVDFWTGGLAERLNPFGGMLGTTFNYVFENTLEDLQFGDRFYYLFRNQGNQLFAGLEGNSFASLIERNTDAENIPAGIFHVNQIEFDLDNPTPLPHGFTRLANGEYRFVGEEHVEMHGTTGDDRMRADQGDDSLWGREGDDVIEGGSGNDLIHGGIGDDIITDLFGDDEIRAGMGNDAVNGGPGFDLLLGGGGHDFITRGGDIGDVFLGDGNDTYLGGTGRANIFGGEGDDWVEGGSHADLAQGDNANQFQNDVIGGDDVVLGRGGDDDIEGEGGDDILVAEKFGTDRHLGNMGWDWVTYYGETEPVDADFNFTLLQRPDTTAVRDRFDQLEALSGGAGNDILRGPDIAVEGEFLGDEEYLHKMTESTLDLVDGLREMLHPAGMNFGQQFMRNGPIIDSDGFPSIIIGGDGSDLIEGRAGNDYIDGDAYLAVELGLVDASGAIIEQHASASAYRARLLTGEINPGDLRIIREIRYAADFEDAVDVAEYADVRSAYEVTPIGDYWQVTHTGAAEAEESSGTDILRGIEVIRFVDTCLILTPGAAAPEDCINVGELRITAADPIMEGVAVTAELFDLEGNPYDLSAAQNVRFFWVGGEGASPEEIAEREELILGGVNPDAGVPNRSTFIPNDSAVDQYLEARVSFEIDGVVHVVTSAPTAGVVQNVNDVGVAPVIGGTPQVDSTLSIGVPSDEDGTEEVVFTYTWQRAATADAADGDWVITKAPGSDPTQNTAYLVTADDEGQFIRVVIEYTDQQGADERVVTAVVGPVVPAPVTP
ncbi:peroxidase family protein [Microbacterium alcoholitolerans]|uniref:peroxidase family protein n=1 Tax=unclassified Microbacterium TaxID=2609290 RepID=UPI003D17B3A2